MHVSMYVVAAGCATSKSTCDRLAATLLKVVVNVYLVMFATDG
uniref:Uncharacterized protein n=1 Tax=Arundo donax TaxID=35708 RepID=A0A0A9HN08_ARUDO